jgi:HAD superfamily hydrolase (TIGR01549 family)
MMPKAILMDVDGTLYGKHAVQRAMLMQLGAEIIARPRAGYRLLRALRAYRTAQERLRRGAECGPASYQYKLAEDISGISECQIRSAVRLWMQQVPLQFIRRSRFPGVKEFCEWAVAHNVVLGVVSDYDAHDKLRALELAPLISAVVCAQDSEVDRFKPDTKGLLYALQKLGAQPHEAIYIGDRFETDALAAIASGLECFLLARSVERTPGVTRVDSWFEIRMILEHRLTT